MISSALPVSVSTETATMLVATSSGAEASIRMRARHLAIRPLFVQRLFVDAILIALPIRR
jgi:hypothetical protein